MLAKPLLQHLRLIVCSLIVCNLLPVWRRALAVRESALYRSTNATSLRVTVTTRLWFALIHLGAGPATVARRTPAFGPSSSEIGGELRLQEVVIVDSTGLRERYAEGRDKIGEPSTGLTGRSS